MKISQSFPYRHIKETADGQQTHNDPNSRPAALSAQVSKQKYTELLNMWFTDYYSEKQNI